MDLLSGEAKIRPEIFSDRFSSGDDAGGAFLVDESVPEVGSNRDGDVSVPEAVWDSRDFGRAKSYPGVDVAVGSYHYGEAFPE